MSTLAPCAAVTAAPAVANAEASVSLGQIIAHFSGIVLVWILILVLLSAVGRLSGTVENKPYQSRMMPEMWPLMAKDVIAMLMLLFGAVPFLLFVVSLIFGAVLGPIEEWSFDVAFEYTLSNVAGLANPLTSIVPTSTLGDCASIGISIWAMLITSSMMGVAGNMGVIQRIITRMPGSILWFTFYIFILIPVLLIAVSFLLAFPLAYAEGWRVMDGFLFMIGSLCGLANPLTSVVPHSPHGVFLEILASVSEVALGGAIVGIVGSHPVCDKFVAYLEGEGTLLKNMDTANRKAERIGKFLGKNQSIREAATIAVEAVAGSVSRTVDEAVECLTEDQSAPDPDTNPKKSPCPDAPSDLRLATQAGGAEPPNVAHTNRALSEEVAQLRADLEAAELRAEKAERRAELAALEPTDVYIPVGSARRAEVELPCVSRAEEPVLGTSVVVAESGSREGLPCARCWS